MIVCMILYRRDEDRIRSRERDIGVVRRNLLKVLGEVEVLGELGGMGLQAVVEILGQMKVVVVRRLRRDLRKNLQLEVRVLGLVPDLLCPLYLLQSRFLRFRIRM